jgi:hypothetical protein
MKEVCFFQNHTVIVTQSRFIVSRNVYEIKNISAVKVEPIKSNEKIKFVLMIIGFLLIFFNGFKLIGISLFFIAFLSLYLKEKIFAVHLVTNSGETDGLISKDREYIEQVVKAINSAMWAQYLKSAPM